MYVIPETKVLFLGEIGQFGGILGNHQCQSSWKMREEQFKDEKGPAVTLVAALQHSGLALSSCLGSSVLSHRFLSFCLPKPHVPSVLPVVGFQVYIF